MLGRPPRIWEKPSVSQVSGPPCAVRCQRLLCGSIELARVGVALDGCVKAIGVKGFEPGTKPCQFPGRQLLDGFLDVFGGCHLGNITPNSRD